MSEVTEAIQAAAPPRTAAKYQYLTQTNRGTRAGELLRRYWQPVELSANLPAGSAPRAVRIMGEDLVLFRDDVGRPGLLGRQCAHRCADLVLGRVEHGGIRCPYHGWLFDVSGRCLQQPAEASSTAKNRVRAKSYPVHEAGGALWAYLGPGDPPLFPNHPAVIAPAGYTYTCRWFGDCNWMQAHEGNIDPIHTSYLHSIELSDPEMKARWGVFSSAARPELTIEDTRFGVRLYTRRQMPDDKATLRITNFVLPNACAVGGFEGYLGDGGLTMLWDVPIDDRSHWRYEFIFHRSGKLNTQALDEQYRSEKIPGTDRMRRSKEDHYSQDRASMGEYYLGLGPCFSVHDVVITQSQGTIHNQQDEHLAASDVAIIRARRLLDEAVRDVEAGKDPRGVFRETAQNELHDLVVSTAVVGTQTKKEEYCATLARDTALYALESRDR